MLLGAAESHHLSVQRPEDYRISTLHSGYVEDNIDATCILLSSEFKDVHRRASADDVIHLGGEKGWARRFNLLARENTLFFFVEEAGDYQIIQSTGTRAGFRFEPLMVGQPEGYKSPAFEEGGGVFSLDPSTGCSPSGPRAEGDSEGRPAGEGPFPALEGMAGGRRAGAPHPGQGRLHHREGASGPPGSPTP